MLAESFEWQNAKDDQPKVSGNALKIRVYAALQFVQKSHSASPYDCESGSFLLLTANVPSRFHFLVQIKGFYQHEGCGRDGCCQRHAQQAGHFPHEKL